MLVMPCMSFPLHESFFFGTTACMIFLSEKFSLQEFFWGIVTPPPVISNGPPRLDKIVEKVEELGTVHFYGVRGAGGIW